MHAMQSFTLEKEYFKAVIESSKLQWVQVHDEFI